MAAVRRRAVSSASAKEPVGAVHVGVQGLGPHPQPGREGGQGRRFARSAGLEQLGGGGDHPLAVEADLRAHTGS
jgi:hypothetical protein